MATQFFERQTAARRSTGWLLGMFCLATVAVVVSVMLVVAIALGLQTGSAGAGLVANPDAWQLPLVAGSATLFLILAGSLFKVLELRAGGGALVAERLGGVRVYPNTTDRVDRRLLNVVEEMAIASGVAVPPVFLLAHEPGINAFAAGYAADDAVIAVTRGCAERLTRDELQGVLAHEFSHILNGDAKIGIRVMGVLFGILLLGLVGQLMFRTLAYSGRPSSRRDSDSGRAYMALMLIALALIVLGFIGTFLGNLIKAAISRQRERLADASGVQFTRNPLGLAGALKRIGALEMGSHLQAANAAEASHLYFAEGVWRTFAGLWSTHPPLAERIRALDPTWDGMYPDVEEATPRIEHELATAFAEASPLVGAGPTSVAPHIVHRAVEHIGNLTIDHVQHAASLKTLIPDAILVAARDPYAARAIVFCLLLHQDSQTRARQLRELGERVPSDLMSVVERLMPAVDGLDPRVRLPLVDLALPALGAMSPGQYQPFLRAFETLARADGEIDLFEWVLSQIVMKQLRSHFAARGRGQTGFQPRGRMANPCAVVLSAVALAGNGDATAQQVFSAAAQRLPELKLNLQTRSASTLIHLQEALAALASASPRDRGRLVEACAAAISADGHATLEEVELLRGISALLGCPMPPLLIDHYEQPVGQTDH
jgi:Zn-dependent protease with chaperone function